ncbi:2Fe-2S iron-sulfur cluster-binding protein [Mycobacterium sp. 1274756.6]|uniref:2Fe-2S iron-sulfur cluster-binding protein n=1 Tax=Mycobacterium sp. 1274756.6 TaxID=1834076 RepID=UPI0007FE15DD|nr:2Fe-2S iron-sulfur cluster-binding protein [Mycobacterium sp. 1274756.6]OBJ73703.1 (2Fe-2S)-binding protein [Mycobacterium sp. 1274756.6]
MPFVTVRPSGIRFAVQPGQTIMAAGEAAGYRWPTICGGVGECTVCHVEVLEADENLDPPSELECHTLEALRGSRGDRVRLACQATVEGDVVVLKRGVRPRRPAPENPGGDRG